MPPELSSQWLAHLLTTRHVPQPDLMVQPPCRQHLAIRAECHRFDSGKDLAGSGEMSNERWARLFSSHDVPNHDCVVATGRG